MSVSLRTKRGTLASLPTLAAGEMYYAEDYNALYIGYGGSNYLLNGFPRGHIYGLPPAYLTATTIQVGAGEARSGDDLADMALAAAVTVDLTATGALGVDAKAIAGTGAVAATSAIVGTGTAFLTAFGVSSNLTGTISSVTTAVTGTGTKFLSQVSINDLIGNSTDGYYRVTDIASDTALTLVSAPAVAFSADTFQRIEQPTIKVAAQAVRRVNTITTNTAMTAETAWTGTSSGNTLTIGGPNGVSGNQSFYIWLASGASGTTVYLSGQRTTPFAVTGYTTSTRRIGSCQYNNSVPGIVPFRATRRGPAVIYSYVMTSDTYANRLVSGSGISAWTRLTARGVVPSTATMLTVLLSLINPAGTVTMGVRCASVDSYASKSSVHRAVTEAGGRSAATYHIGCDGAQCIDWVLNAVDANNPAFIEVAGYEEELP